MGKDGLSPFRSGDVRRVSGAVERASLRRVCAVLEVPRSGLCAGEARCAAAPPHSVNESLAAQLRALIQTHPTFGYRRLWAMLQSRYGLLVNRKAVYRILKVKGWFCHQPIFPHSPLKTAIFASICGVSRVLSVAPFPKTAVVQTYYLDGLAGA